MFFTILAYIICITAVLGFFFFSIFPCEMLLGKPLGYGSKAEAKRKRAIAGRKWEKKMFGIRDIFFWIE